MKKRFSQNSLVLIIGLAVVLGFVILVNDSGSGGGLLSPKNISSNSILKFHPGSGIEPKTNILVDAFFSTDVNPKTVQNHWAFGALADTFAGDDFALREKFREDFSNYHIWNFLNRNHPDCIFNPDENVRIIEFVKPYLVDQVSFLSWLNENTDKSDFLEVGARKNNNYLGNQKCPLVLSAMNIGTLELRERFGYAISISKDKIVLNTDNRHNPMRWMGTINQIHHHENPSLFSIFDVKEADINDTKEILSNYLKDVPEDRKILLEYDLSLTVEDYGPALGELSPWHLYGGIHPSKSENLIGTFHWNSYYYSLNGTGVVLNGTTYNLSRIERRMVNKSLYTRFFKPDVSTNIVIQFRPRGDKYRAAEFMVADKNIKSSIYSPEEDGFGRGFLVSNNSIVNDYAVRGGVNGHSGWWRANINLLKEPGLFPFGSTPLISGGEYFEIPEGNSQQNLKGVIDITEFYKLSREGNFFPGQRGYWVNAWRGFEGDLPEFIDSNEEHGIYWAGVLIENHGPQKVVLELNDFNVCITGKDAINCDAEEIIDHPFCGDGTCDTIEGEDCNTCSIDCGACEIESPVCGNGVVEGNEVCDGGEQICFTIQNYFGVQNCLSDCSGFNECISGEFCGDGTVNGNEECDDEGFVGKGDTCNNKCEKISVWQRFWRWLTAG